MRFQQIQKYETDHNRVSASKLFDISTALNVPVSYFFAGVVLHSEDEESEWGKILDDKSVTEMIVVYYRIPETSWRAFFDVIEALAGQN